MIIPLRDVVELLVGEHRRDHAVRSDVPLHFRPASLYSEQLILLHLHLQLRVLDCGFIGLELLLLHRPPSHADSNVASARVKQVPLEFSFIVSHMLYYTNYNLVTRLSLQHAVIISALFTRGTATVFMIMLTGKA